MEMLSAGRGSRGWIAGFISLVSAGMLAGCGGATNGTPAPTPPVTVAGVSLSVTSLSFGTTAVGSVSAAQTVTLSSVGTAPVALGGVAASGDFQVTSNSCGATLGVGSTCAVTTTFTPTVAGARTGTLSIVTNAPGSPATVALSGVGGTSAVSYSPATLNFGTVALGSTSPGQVVTVTSSGNAPVTLTAGLISGDFTFTASTCVFTPQTTAPGTTCTFTVVFSPFQPGTRTGLTSLASNAVNAAPAVTLTGVGGSTTNSVSSTAQNFAAQVVGTTSAAQMVTITATGTVPLYLSSLALSGDFTRPATTCNAALAPGTSCTVSVAFAPTVVGARTGTLTIGSNGTSSPQVVSLSGTGIPAPSVAGLPVTVKAMAGTLPISGASLQLYAAGAVGSRMGATPLLANSVATDATGTAVLSGYTCPTAATPVYVLAKGGTVGTAASSNANALLMTAIGPCGSVASGSTVVVNEASSVAAVYALQQFYAAGGVIGTTATNLTGITNAFGTAVQLIDPSTGATPVSYPATASSPAARVNSLANLLNECLTVPSQCGTLYAATELNGALPTNTLDALFNLAQQPAANTSALFTQSMLSTAYTPALTAVPADFTMFVNYTGAGMNSPSGIGIDSTGSVWAASYFYTAAKFTPLGLPVFTNGVTGVGLNNSYGLAVDLTDNPWIPNEQPYTNYGIGSVTRLTPAGADASGTGGGYQQGGLNYPLSVALDPNGTTWVVDYGNSHVTLLNGLGTPTSGLAGYTTPLFAFPVAVAVDANHFGWIANQSGNTVTKVAPDGSSFTNYNCCVGASGIAIDQGNNVWVANFYGDSVSLISNTGVVVGNATYTGNGGITRPQGIAIDGNGNVWVANYRQTYLTELAGVGSATVGASMTPKTGYGADAGLLEAYALSIDASGNIWVSNQGSNSVTKYIGLAAPVKTPLSALPKAP